MWPTLLGVGNTKNHPFWKRIILVGTWEKGPILQNLKGKNTKRKKIEF